ncbi:MAG TPA: SH3 domain-containing protein [Sandaracinaceae bacterium LLY-WYZ-13_1]|nr:SH3 domain-containing protein [Sandaracinaceae bacterium LLY-WYZ-13_1]
MSRACVAVALLVALAPLAASAQDEPGADEGLAEGVYARVIVDRTELRSGPGASYQRVRVASRGDVFKVVQRASTGYWFRVELADGTYAWIHGDTVYNHQVSREEATGGRFAPDVFAPPPLPSATGELAVQFGILGFFNGFMAVRPAINVAPELELELNLGGSVGDSGRLLIGSGGPLINIWPESPVVPFFTVGGGFAVSDPNADTFLLESGMVGVLYGGGGLRFGFRYRITFRIEARGYAFFDENRIVALEEITGGLTVFF